RLLALAALSTLVALPSAAHHAPAEVRALAPGPTDGLAFAENRGQWPEAVLFQAHLGGATAWVTADGVTFDFHRAVTGEPAAPDTLGGAARVQREGHVVRMRFEGGQARRAVGHGRKAAYHSYFLGSDPARWAPRVPLFGEVVLEGLYDGVDLRLYDDGGRLRYDLVLVPGADASQIRMRMEGADGLSLTPEGALRMATALGPVEHRGLLAYQEGAARRRDVVASAFQVEPDGGVSFDVEG